MLNWKNMLWKKIWKKNNNVLSILVLVQIIHVNMLELDRCYLVGTEDVAVIGNM